MPRVGVFGGAFDPPHNAHVALVQAALAQLGLAELRIFPTGQAWHKARALSSAEHRLAMARLAFGGVADAVVDTREIRRAGPTYTLDTLRELKNERPDMQPVLLIGADQAAALRSWHGFEEILSIAIISIAHRADPTGAAIRFDPQTLAPLPAGARFEQLELAPMDISATEIRSRAARGADISGLVPPAVARYIDRHHLYSPA
ncbi:nicotinate (nicotinamide) nucleotide adenylyltransferase [Variovorax sp. J22G21]|uniref:nicotinate (nicotinamide) nucleotide adenylyltransferase n=1 Tax=Variovorax fucosicus TaxID=3053517 RepID=UPI0025788476|nr:MULTISPECIES: nicotinate (nicotinamide) nucleotide adenylyltransferase [unclassified Variovorax]MDM0041016.1 nicotinate (nicotinamide) nucleotide adenylyltransferase [Variovorax sp. J22R193]MDM0060073.1 nicotinate (nicotinamide) nucleotide adenylyltransferase [Variovorax sp. J22G21]